MVLTKHDIVAQIKSGGIRFSPNLDGFQLQPHAVDLRLGTTFKLARTWKLTDKGREAINIDPLNASKENFEEVEIKPGQYFELLPKEFVIAVTYEEITINSGDLMAILFPRSSINRRGLSVDLSGIIDVGYSGRLVIPILNNTNEQVIKVYPGERICQIVFQKLTSELKPEDWDQHGLQKAKYHKSAEYLSKSDSDIEGELIRKGAIAKIKKDFKLQYE
jgi:dCTP deaminase